MRIVFCSLLAMATLLGAGPANGAASARNQHSERNVMSQSADDDDFGYTWSPAPFEWIDMSDATPAPGNEYWPTVVKSLPLPFEFRYFDVVRHAGERLDLTFDGRVPLSAAEAYSASIYYSYKTISSLRWNGIATKTGGSAPNRFLAIQYTDVMQGVFIYGNGPMDYQIVLYEDNSIRLARKLRGPTLTDSVVLADPGLDYLLTKVISSYQNSVPAGELAINCFEQTGACVFHRPASPAHLLVNPNSERAFAYVAAMNTYTVTVKNRGDVFSDTVDIVLTSTWPASITHAMSGAVITDTDGDSIPDSGPMIQGESLQFHVHVSPPLTATALQAAHCEVTFRSSVDTGINKQTSLTVVVPTNFVAAGGNWDVAPSSLVRIDRHGAGITPVARPRTLISWSPQSGYQVAQFQNGNFLVVRDGTDSESGSAGRYHTVLNAFGDALRPAQRTFAVLQNAVIVNGFIDGHLALAGHATSGAGYGLLNISADGSDQVSFQYLAPSSEVGDNASVLVLRDGTLVVLSVVNYKIVARTYMPDGTPLALPKIIMDLGNTLYAAAALGQSAFVVASGSIEYAAYDKNLALVRPKTNINTPARTGLQIAAARLTNGGATISSGRTVVILSEAGDVITTLPLPAAPKLESIGVDETAAVFDAGDGRSGIYWSTEESYTSKESAPVNYLTITDSQGAVLADGIRLPHSLRNHTMAPYTPPAHAAAIRSLNSIVGAPNSPLSIPLSLGVYSTTPATATLAITMPAGISYLGADGINDPTRVLTTTDGGQIVTWEMSSISKLEMRDYAIRVAAPDAVWGSAFRISMTITPQFAEPVTVDNSTSLIVRVLRTTFAPLISNQAQ